MDIDTDRNFLRTLGTGDLTPTAADLDSAPFIDGWHVEKFGDGYRVVGIVAGHPRLPDGPVATSHPVHANLDAGWLRTFGRFYRLGRHADDVWGAAHV